MAKGRKQRSGIRQFKTPACSADDFQPIEPTPLFSADKFKSDIRWEDVHEIYDACNKVLDTYVKELTSSGQAYHMRTVAMLNGPEFQFGITTNLQYLYRDVDAWRNILRQIHEPISQDKGKVPDSRMLEWHNIGVELSTVMDGIDNSLTPLLSEIGTWVITGDQNIIGYNLAELEALPADKRRSLITHQYTTAIEKYNTTGMPKIDLKSVLTNLTNERTVKHLN